MATRGTAQRSAKKAAPKTAAKKTTAKKTTAAQQGTAKKTTAKKTTTKKTTAKKTTAKKTAVKKTATKATAAKKSAGNKSAAKKQTSQNQTAATRRSAKTTQQPPTMVVAGNEKPWTAEELAALRNEIETDIAQLEQEIAAAEAGLMDLLQDAGDSAGEDQADAGTKTFEREQEISLANNARELLEQNRRAMERMDDGTYGICENCGNPIGKLRLQAAPRATLCMPCKMKEERR